MDVFKSNHNPKFGNILNATNYVPSASCMKNELDINLFNIYKLPIFDPSKATAVNTCIIISGYFFIR